MVEGGLSGMGKGTWLKGGCQEWVRTVLREGDPTLL